MTLFLVDIASYQHNLADPIDLAAAQQKGISLVNIKTTQGTDYVFTAGRQYADTARSLGMGICTFHYLTNEGSGKAQADFAWKQILNLGGPEGIAHECDCETNATEQIYRDYMSAMQDRFGRHILTYSGDWWWPSDWYGADLTPYYTAAPNAGYLGSYPGDGSHHWRAGYGGWEYLSMMQYAVGTIAGVGGADLSQSAIRDPAVWAALTGGTQKEITMLMGLVKGDATVYVGNGVACRALDAYSDGTDAGNAAVQEAYKALLEVAKIQQLPDFSSLAALEAALGKVGGTPVPAEVDAAELAAELAPLMPKPPVYTSTPAPSTPAP